MIVGNVPATYDSNGNLLSVGQGSLLILDSNGKVVTTLSDSQLPRRPLGPDRQRPGEHGPGVRLQRPERRGDPDRPDDPQGRRSDRREPDADRFGLPTRTDPAALVVGPTGLAYDAKNGTLYVASTGDNEIFAVPNAGDPHERPGNGQRGLSGRRAPPRAARPGPGAQRRPDHRQRRRGQPRPESDQRAGRVHARGQFVGQFSLDPAAGGAFGLAATNVGGILRLAAVEDVTNSLDVWTFQTGGKSSAPR